MTAKLPANLDLVIATMRRRWELQIGEPYQPGGTCSWVARVLVAGEPAVLKVGWPHPEAEHEAAGLQLWDGEGAVRVFNAAVVDGTPVLLLERCEPGRTLAASVPEDSCDEVVAGLLRQLWRPPPRDAPFRPLAQMCSEWAAEAAERIDRISPPDVSMVRAGLTLFRELPATATEDRVLATDLHAGNILAAQRAPWLAIDPKPYVGDPTYDVLQHMLNMSRLRTDPVGLADRMASLLDLDRYRLRSWIFARCAIEAAADPGLVTVMRLLS